MIPVIVATVGCAVVWFLAGRDRTAALAPVVLSLAWWISIAASLFLRQGQWSWPEDAWRQAIGPLLVASVFVGGSVGLPARFGVHRWALAGLAATLTAMIAMPSGEAWSDTFASHRVWTALVTASILVNAFAVERMSERRFGREASRWSLWIGVASLGGPMVLAASAYASLSEWNFSIIVTTAVVAAFAAISPRVPGHAIGFPVFAAAAGLTAAGRFYSYIDYPPWVYAMLLFGPAIVATIDLIIQELPTWLRVIVAATCSGAMVGFSAWIILA